MSFDCRFRKSQWWRFINPSNHYQSESELGLRKRVSFLLSFKYLWIDNSKFDLCTGNFLLTILRIHVTNTLLFTQWSHFSYKCGCGLNIFQNKCAFSGFKFCSSCDFSTVLTNTILICLNSESCSRTQNLITVEFFFILLQIHTLIFVFKSAQ